MSAVLAVIGPNWLHAAADQGRRRLNNLSDRVRLELKESLRRPNVLVVPLLVGYAQMPRVAELPESLQDLVCRNYRLARPDPDFHKDVSRLIIDLEQHFKQTTPQTPQIEKVTSLPIGGLRWWLSWGLLKRGVLLSCSGLRSIEVKGFSRPKLLLPSPFQRAHQLFSHSLPGTKTIQNAK